MVPCPRVLGSPEAPPLHPGPSVQLGVPEERSCGAGGGLELLSLALQGVIVRLPSGH